MQAISKKLQILEYKKISTFKNYVSYGNFALSSDTAEKSFKIFQGKSALTNSLATELVYNLVAQALNINSFFGSLAKKFSYNSALPKTFY